MTGVRAAAAVVERAEGGGGEQNEKCGAAMEDSGVYRRPGPDLGPRGPTWQNRKGI